MNIHADKTQKDKSQSAENGVSQKKNRADSTFQFVDNRPEVFTQKRLQELANNPLTLFYRTLCCTPCTHGLQQA